MKKLLLFALLLVLICPSRSFAYRVYRCNGRVQFRPCEQPFINKVPPIPPARPKIIRETPEALPTPPLNIFAKLESSSFSKISPTEGLWKGKVRGNGRIHLVLRILEDERIESSIYMGSVPLSHKTTGFNFRSSLPKNKNWSWVIEASATPS